MGGILLAEICKTASTRDAFCSPPAPLGVRGPTCLGALGALVRGRKARSTVPAIFAVGGCATLLRPTYRTRCNLQPNIRQLDVASPCTPPKGPGYMRKGEQLGESLGKSPGAPGGSLAQRSTSRGSRPPGSKPAAAPSSPRRWAPPWGLPAGANSVA